MKLGRILTIALVALVTTTSALAQTGGTGAVTGTLRPFGEACKQPPRSMYGTVAIPGTSYSAFFTKSGKFTMYNVRPGTYSLGIWSLNGNSFNFSGTALAGPNKPIKTGVKVQPGKTTNLGTVVLSDSCCGNGFIDAGEECDPGGTGELMSNGKTCQDFGFDSGELFCGGCKLETFNCVNNG